MNAIINGALALAVAVAAVGNFSRGRRVLAALLGTVAAGWACVAVRNLPEPAVVAGQLVVLAGVAAITVWPLIRPRGGHRAWSGRRPR